MHIHAAQPLFAWGQLEDCPTLATIRAFLHTVPNPPLLDGLRSARGQGRDDYPVARLWHVVLLTLLLRYHSLNDCLAQLHRNPALCRLIGINAQEQILTATTCPAFSIRSANNLICLLFATFLMPWLAASVKLCLLWGVPPPATAGPSRREHPRYRHRRGGGASAG